MPSSCRTFIVIYMMLAGAAGLAAGFIDVFGLMHDRDLYSRNGGGWLLVLGNMNFNKSL